MLTFIVRKNMALSQERKQIEMGLDRPVGNVIINTKRGGPFEVDEDELSNFILPDADIYSTDEPRKYVDGNNNQFTVGEYAKDIKKLSSIEF